MVDLPEGGGAHQRCRPYRARTLKRFITYLGLGRDTDPTPLVGWAGWDHLDSARALAATYEQRRSVDGWGAERLSPILAGLIGPVPWLRQWHNDSITSPASDSGTSSPISSPAGAPGSATESTTFGHVRQFAPCQRVKWTDMQ